MKKWLGFALGFILAGALAAGQAAAQDYAGFGNAGSDPGLFGIFDEVRGGTAFSVDKNDDTGLLVSGMLFFRSFVPPQQNYFANTLLRPRPFIGGNLAVEDDGISQVYGGLTWNFPVFGPVFIEASFGGTWHDGPKESVGDGPDLGCSVLFHERLGVGVDVGQHWRIVGEADHSSHAGLCDGGNSGLTHAGAYVGYRF